MNDQNEQIEKLKDAIKIAMDALTPPRNAEERDALIALGAALAVDPPQPFEGPL